MLSTLLISLLIVKLFTVSVWGNIVSLLVIQQIVSGILAWGNKDYLQRELATNPDAFGSNFTQLFLERLLLFILIILVVFIFGLIDRSLLFSFILIIFWRFINQSFDILVIKERRFLTVFFLDCILILLQVGLVFWFKNQGNHSLTMLLLVFWFPLALKCLLLFYVFRENFKKTHFKKWFMIESFFFAMMTISGLLHGKIDLLVVSKLLDYKTLGEYQILMSFLWCIQSISMYISSPFIHNFYRLKEVSQANLSKLLKNLGLLIVPIAVVIVMLILSFGFRIKIDASITIASFLFCMASFIYLPWIFQLNQKKLEYRVVLINIIGSLFLIGLILITNYYLGLSLEKIIWTITIHQGLITLMVFFANKTPFYAKQDN